MASPFPGMDPYLEEPALWPDVHHRLISGICDQLQPLITPRYTARIEAYAAMEVIDLPPRRVVAPDVAVIERGGPAPRAGTAVIAAPPIVGAVATLMPTRYGRISIRTTRDETVVTIIEILSPVNKRPGADAADAYERKRRDIFDAGIHLLEIDLLRGGHRPSLATKRPPGDYFVMLSRAEQHPLIGIWPITLANPLPTVPVPLRNADADVPLDLAAVLAHIYASARYDLQVDYHQPPPPPDLPEEAVRWLETLLHERGLR